MSLNIQRQQPGAGQFGKVGGKSTQKSGKKQAPAGLNFAPKAPKLNKAPSQFALQKPQGPQLGQQPPKITGGLNTHA